MHKVNSLGMVNHARAALSGLGFDLESYMGTYTITDRRAALDLPSAIQPVICQSLEEVATPVSPGVKLQAETTCVIV
jgi:hypothetical protein